MTEQATLSEWNQAITTVLCVLRNAEDAERVRGLMRDETPRGAADRNIGRTARWDNQTGRIVGVVNERKRDRLCYVIAGAFGRVERTVESVEVVT